MPSPPSRLRLAAASLLLVGVAACSGAAASQGDVDLRDPDLLAQLAVETPASTDWVRTIEGVEIAGSGTMPDPGELTLLQAALAEVPGPILDLADVRRIYRVPDAYAVEVEDATLAFSRGPDVYLLDRTFTSSPTRMEMARVLTHELTHIVQFNALEAGDVAAILASDSDVKDPIAASSLVREFAAAVGWIDRSGDPGNPEWSIATSAGTTSYGGFSPDEDMAETVSLLAMGRGEDLSPERVRWVAEWLDVDGRSLVAGKPYIPAGATPVDSAQPIYDEAGVARLGPARVEPEYFALPVSSATGTVLAADVGAALTHRGLGGVLAEIDDPAVERYSGHFLRGDGVSFWVELWDFRNAPGYRNPPNHPLLTYVVLW